MLKKLLMAFVVAACSFGLVACDSDDDGAKAGDGLYTFTNESSQTVTVNPEGQSSFALAPGESKTIGGGDTLPFTYSPSSVNLKSVTGEDQVFTD